MIPYESTVHRSNVARDGLRIVSKVGCYQTLNTCSHALPTRNVMEVAKAGVKNDK